jgi:hypothetical protein
MMICLQRAVSSYGNQDQDKNHLSLNLGKPVVTFEEGAA